MIIIAGSFRLPLDQVEAARPAMARIIEASRTEPGCVTYHFSEDVLEPGLFCLFEVWASGEALDEHLATDHFQTWLREREELKFYARDVVRYQVGESRPA